MRLHVFEPDPRLAPILMHFLAVEYDSAESHLPARVSPALMLFVRGGAEVAMPGAAPIRSARFTLGGAIMAPRRMAVDPGTQSILVMFRPAMLQQALDLPATDLTARSVDMRELVDRGRVEGFLRQMDEALPLAECIRLLQEFLLSIFNSARKYDIGSDLAAAHHKLFFPVAELAPQFGIGERQLERRLQQAFGLPLRELRRIVRFGLTLRRLSSSSVAWGDLTAIAQESGYYDQAHMHREFVDLSGLAPIQLVQKIAGDDPAYWLYRIRQPHFNQLFIPVDGSVQT